MVFGALFAAGWWTGRGRASGAAYAKTDLFLEVLHAVDLNYVDPVDPTRLVRGALRGMLHDLDPRAQFMTREEYADWRRGVPEPGEGVGLTLDVRAGWPVVVAPLEGSPAWDAGLRAGDVLTRIGERSAYGLALDEVQALLQGVDGSTVELLVSRGGHSDPRDVTLVHRSLTIRSIPDAFLAPADLAVVRLAAFTDQTREQLGAKLDSLRRAGARRLVLDLRGNASGGLPQALAVAGLFVPAGSKLAETRGRDSARSHVHLASDRRPLLDWPMAVLVDHGSAGASEVVAGALQDLDRALIVGETTFGRAAVQDVFPLHGDEGAVRLTVALDATPSGRLLQPPPRAASVAEDSGADDDEAAAPPAADSIAAPTFKSQSGRTVIGGGGITPDLVVAADSTAQPGPEADRRAVWLADPVCRAAADRLRAARGPRDVWAARLGNR